MNVFTGSPYEMTTMTEAFRDSEYLPQRLGEFFEEKSVTTKDVTIEKKGKVLHLIPTSERGAPLDEFTGEKREFRVFQTARLAKGSTITATEIANIRAFGTSSELEQIENKVAERVMDLDDDLELSFERMRLGAVQGLFVDPKTGETIYNWFTELGVSQPTEINFDLDNASPAEGALVKVCNEMTRAILKASAGATTPQTRIKGLVSPEFWDSLTAHKEVRETYKNWMQAESLRGEMQKPYSSLTFGGIDWEEYRGTDDDTKVAIAANKAIFFPVGVKGNLVHTSSPSDEHMEFVNTPGQRKYTLLEIDPSTNKKWVRPEIYAYPLFYVTRPLTLRRGKKA